MDMENIKKVVKESIIQNFMEAAKFARRGAEKQRPKSWSKGTKSGSDKRKMREQGKRDASEMHEQYMEPGYQYNPQPDDDANDRYAKEIKQEKEQKTIGKNISNAVYDWVEETGIHKAHGHSAEEAREALDKSIEKVYDFEPNIKDNIEHAVNNLLDVYPAPKGTDPEEYKKHMTQGIYGYATADSAEHRSKMLAGNPYFDAITESHDVTSYFYNKLKENTEIPRHARETPEETPDYYGQLEQERAEGRSNEEPPKRAHTSESVAKMLHQAHQTALAKAATAFGPGGKHAKQDPFHMIGHYADELASLHTRIMGDLS